MNKSYDFVYQDKLKEGRLAESLVTRSTLIKENRPSIFILESSKKVSQVEPFRWFTVGKPTGSVAHKTIFLVGATGSGKSTLVDAMVNYILGVKWDDPFRFKVVPDENQCGTRCITSYTIHHTEGMTILYTLTIIDTPGFGDEGTMKTICEFFVHSETKIDYINAIGFVVLQSTGNYLRRKHTSYRQSYQSSAKIFEITCDYWQLSPMVRFLRLLKLVLLLVFH